MARPGVSRLSGEDISSAGGVGSAPTDAGRGSQPKDQLYEEARQRGIKVGRR